MTERQHDPFSFATAHGQFEAAWHDTRHTRFELPAVDVNQVLARRYTATPPVRMSRPQLWDMEVKKAWDPHTYIPYVVSKGQSWGRHRLDDGCERFFRASDQAAWVGDGRGQVLEDVTINHETQTILFLGRASFAGPDGETLRADDDQPLFHVEHAAAGAADAPVNLWRIVILTPAEDARFKRPFEAMVASGLLPGFIETYITRDLGSTLQRLPAAGADPTR